MVIFLRLGPWLEKSCSVWSIAQLLCDHFRMSKSDFFGGQVYTWSFPSLLALVGVTIEKGLHWLRKATITTRLQRGVAPWSRSSAPVYIYLCVVSAHLEAIERKQKVHAHAK